MSQQTYQSPVPPHHPVRQQPRNGVGITGFVLGLTGLVFSPIPVVGMIAWPLVILGLIFSVVGVVRVKSGKADNKWLSIFGIITSVVGLVVSVVWVAVIGSAVNDVQEEVNRVAKVTYEVTGDAKNVDVTYGEVLEPKEEKVATLPWTKEVENKGVIKGGTLTITTGEEGGSVTCKITVDGQVVSTKTATGEFAVVMCSGT
ncbi:MAG TPA: MmpS family transport accessory protein [Lentzea sp.]